MNKPAPPFGLSLRAMCKVRLEGLTLLLTANEPSEMVGTNSLLVFEVELLEINPAS